MPTRKEKAREARHKARDAAEAAEAGPMRPMAKRNFAPPLPIAPARIPNPPPLMDREVISPRADQVGTERAYIPSQLRNQLGPEATLSLSEGMHAAASRSGYRGAKHIVMEAQEKESAAKAAEDKKPKPPPLGSLELDDALLQKAFETFDLDKNEVVGAKELKHLFAQLGEFPKDSEIDGMIQLCDVRGDGAVQFEDFLAIFSCPQESLRGVDVGALQAIVLGEEEEEEESESEEVEEEESSSGSSLEPQR